jgi:hypothetical protein
MMETAPARGGEALPERLARLGVAVSVVDLANCLPGACWAPAAGWVRVEPAPGMEGAMAAANIEAAENGFTPNVLAQAWDLVPAPDPAALLGGLAQNLRGMLVRAQSGGPVAAAPGWAAVEFTATGRLPGGPLVRTATRLDAGPGPDRGATRLLQRVVAVPAGYSGPVPENRPAAGSGLFAPGPVAP